MAAMSIMAAKVDPPAVGDHTHLEIRALHSCRCSDAIIQARALRGHLRSIGEALRCLALPL